MSFQYEVQRSNTPKIIVIAMVGAFAVFMWGSLLSALS